MGPDRWHVILGAGGLVTLLSITSLLEAVYLEGPPLAHTGSFGGDSCHLCHFDNDLDAPGGSLALTGLPDVFDPSATYRITVTLVRPDMVRGGFQLSARVTDGDHAGRQAGTLWALDGRVQVIEGPDAVVYAQHAKLGTELTGNGMTSWTVEWHPPDTENSPITMHVAANAANNDASEFGDFIYTASVPTYLSTP